MHENENISGCEGGSMCWKDPSPPFYLPQIRYHIQDHICQVWTLKLFRNWGVNIGRQIGWKEMERVNALKSYDPPLNIYDVDGIT